MKPSEITKKRNSLVISSLPDNTCIECVFFDEIDMFDTDKELCHSEFTGICKRRPPAFNPKDPTLALQPEVFSSQWCGEFKDLSADDRKERQAKLAELHQFCVSVYIPEE